ncbi:hypothetical protein LX86_002388 [Lentzea aerocolonigenes]|nr:hypothetical protein [Lentzea aerocolonigenes]
MFGASREQVLRALGLTEDAENGPGGVITSPPPGPESHAWHSISACSDPPP